MKVAVIYKTFLGTTKKYAQWIAEEYDADLLKFNEITDEVLNNYDLVVVTSGTYAAQMPLINFLKKYWQVLRTKRVVVVAVGMAPPDDPQSIKSYELIPDHIQSLIHYFKVPGKLFASGPGGEPARDKLEKVFKKIDVLVEDIK